MNRLLRTILIILIVSGGALLFYTKLFIPKHSYQTIHPLRGEMNLSVFGIATVEAKTLYPVGSTYGGKLLSVLKDQGESVQKGELIARLDPVDLPDQIAEAKANLQSLRFSLQAARKDLESLKAQLKLAQIEFARYQKLSPEGYAPESEYDKAQANLQSIQAQIAAKQAQIEALKAQENEARLNIDALQKRLSRFELYAPVSGLVVRRDAQPAQTVAPQQPILTIVRPRDVWVSATIDEALSQRLRPGEPATIRLRSRPDSSFSGTVARIEPESDPVTEERIVEVAFDRLLQPFYLKEQAEMTIQTGKLENAIILPKKALQHGGVWINRNGRAHFVKVKVLAEQGDKSAVEGLKGDETILLPDPRKKPLSEGTRVYR